MRTDHLAYQQATRVAGMGFLLQAAIGLIMLVYGFIFKDSAFQVASEPILVRPAARSEAISRKQPIMRYASE